MSANLDDARRAWEAAKRITCAWLGSDAFHADARLLLTNATSDYAQALVDDQLRKFDGAGIRVGETTVIADGIQPFVIGQLVADVPAGRVKAWSDSGGGWAYADELRPYTAPEAKQIVLYGLAESAWSRERHFGDLYRITLANVTSVDLNAMKPGEVIEGTFKIEGVGK